MDSKKWETSFVKKQSSIVCLQDVYQEELECYSQMIVIWLNNINIEMFIFVRTRNTEFGYFSFNFSLLQFHPLFLTAPPVPLCCCISLLVYTCRRIYVYMLRCGISEEFFFILSMNWLPFKKEKKLACHSWKNKLKMT